MSEGRGLVLKAACRQMSRFQPLWLLPDILFGMDAAYDLGESTDFPKLILQGRGPKENYW